MKFDETMGALLVLAFVIVFEAPGDKL